MNIKKIFVVLTTLCFFALQASEPTKLMKAVLNNDCKTVVELLGKEVDQTLAVFVELSTDKKAKQLRYPLHMAVYNGSECIVRELLNAPGAQEVLALPVMHMFGSHDDFFTPLHIAVKLNNRKMVKLVLDAMKRYNIHHSLVKYLVDNAQDDNIRKLLMDYE